MARYDLVIRGGVLADGLGGAPREADVAVSDGVIAAVGRFPGAGAEEIDAKGLLVTPGWVDAHTHYDGQATWDHRLAPSSDHGVTSVVMGNCGVGFAPCRPEDRARLISLMEGVEDIPNPVLAEGLAWDWESFPDYLDALERRPHDIDFAAQAPHGALRVFAMGERGAKREAASDHDIAAMRDAAAGAIRAGALGFSTSRTLNHRTADGDPTPSYDAAARELIAIAEALGEAGGGVLQVVSDFADGPAELAMLEQMSARSGRPLVFSLLQHPRAPQSWRALLGWVEGQAAAGRDVKAMVCGRPVGLMLGLSGSLNPFMLNPVYQEVAGQPLAGRLAALRDPAFRARLLSAEAGRATNAFDAVVANWAAMFELGDPPDYEQPLSNSLAARAAALGRTPAELALDLISAGDGGALLYSPFLNYAEYSLDPARAMMLHPNTVLGLSDGGAHVGMICDASFPTSMLTHWTRDRTRGEKLDLGFVVAAQSRRTAAAFGLMDRGVVAPGYKADLNVIDYDRLRLRHPRIVADLPAGGRRLMQAAEGYVATLVSGVAIQRDGTPTGALPGNLIRGAQPAPSKGLP